MTHIFNQYFSQPSIVFYIKKEPIQVLLTLQALLWFNFKLAFINDKIIFNHVFDIGCPLI